MEPTLGGQAVLPSAARPAKILQRVLGRIVDFCAGVLVVVETGVLLTGVISRFVFDSPLTWSDELASILFLWLAMLGAVLAYRRLEHMRMGALVDGSPRLKPFADALGLVAGLTFLGFVFHPALNYTLGEMAITTPALGWPNAWRVAALPVGIDLMLAFGLLRCLRLERLVEIAAALAVVGAIAALLFLAKPLLTAMGN